MRILMVVSTLGLGLAPVPGSAADPASGAALFRQTCATCHGLSARGDGPMASVLTVPMPDLTLLSARNGDVFPLARIVAAIDGRTALPGHGGPMPVYGFSLMGEGVALSDATGAEVRTSASIAAIAAWLESVQR